MTKEHHGGSTPPTELHLSDQQDLSALSTLVDPSRLTMLTLHHCHLSDLSPLARLQGLTTLSLSNCEQISDLSPLVGLQGLTTLSVNPARAFGPYLVTTIFGYPVSWIVFVVSYLIGPLLEGVVEAFAYGAVAAGVQTP